MSDGPAWNDPLKWKALCSGEGCPVCQRGEPLGVLVGLEASWLTMQERAPARGYGRPIDAKAVEPPVYAAGEFSVLRRTSSARCPGRAEPGSSP